MTTELKVADITLQQLGGRGRLTSMIGAKHIYSKDEGNTLVFKFMRGARNKANYIEVTLEPNDTYRMTFFKIFKMDVKPVSSHAQVYNSELRAIFERETGLYLSL